MEVIPFKKRNVVTIVFSIIATLFFVTAAIVVWAFVLGGVRDAFAIIMAVALTALSGLSVMTLITGRMEWLLLGFWDIPF